MDSSNKLDLTRKYIFRNLNQSIETFFQQDGTRYYKVRWVKFSWEPEASFTHLEHLIQAFWEQNESQRLENIKVYDYFFFEMLQNSKL